MGFNFTELEAGERIVLGPVTTTKTTSVSGGVGPDQKSLSRTSGRTVGVTTQRVIIEDLKTPEGTQIIPNVDVQKVFIKRQQQKGQASLTLLKVQTAGGPAVKLDIRGLPSQSETIVREIFPNASIVEVKGSKTLLIIAIVLGALVFFACVLPLLLGLLANLLGGG
ncbi:MAG TPA: hypothetical protein G4O00_07240 [Thermoflexia bacterium]|nr:hypothetical protein [Thermoflexia bacterium]